MIASPDPVATTTQRDMLAEYEDSHQNAINRAFHTWGIPMIVLSLPLLSFGPWRRGGGRLAWRGGLGLFTLGWIFQFIGHAFEGRPPEFLRDWRFLFVGTRWWLKKMRAGA